MQQAVFEMQMRGRNVLPNYSGRLGAPHARIRALCGQCSSSACSKEVSCWFLFGFCLLSVSEGRRTPSTAGLFYTLV